MPATLRPRLINMAVFGSVGRGASLPDSDIDLLIVADPLQAGRVARSDASRIVFDRDGFLRGALDAFAARLAHLGARRIWRGEHWFWDLKPDYQPGDVFEL